MRRLCLLSVFLSVVAIVLATIALLTGRGDKMAPPPDTTVAPDKTDAPLHRSCGRSEGAAATGRGRRDLPAARGAGG